MDIMEMPPPYTDEDRIRKQIEIIKEKIKTGSLIEAIKDCDLLVYSVEKINGDCTPIFDYIKELNELFKPYYEHQTPLSLLEWYIRLIADIEDTKTRLKNLNFVGRKVWIIGYELHCNYNTEPITDLVIPLFRRILDKIKQVECGDSKFAAEMQVWCLYYITNCYHYVNDRRVHECCDAALSLAMDTYGDEAEKHRIVSLCHSLSAKANCKAKNYREAIEDYQESIRTIKCAEDICVKSKKRTIQCHKKDLARTRQSKLLKTIKTKIFG